MGVQLGALRIRRTQVAALGALLWTLACGGTAERPPNVLFVLVDDLRWDALGAYGNQDVRTPHLDRLANEGVRLDALYTASPICNPSRASFLTGRYPHQRGVHVRPGWSVADDITTVARVMGRAGFVTGFVGKAHLGGVPSRWGFDETPIVIPGYQLWAPDSAGKVFVGGVEERYEGHITERLADAAIDFLTRHRDERWLLWLATTEPHSPYVRHPDFPYEPEALSAPPGWPQDRPFEPGLLPVYYSMVSRVDREIGRVLEALDALGLREETLVFVTSDNGVEHDRGPFVKGSWREGSIRIPGLVRWPGTTQPATVRRGLASSVDWLPTLLDLVGEEAPEALEGRSLLPLLRGDGDGRRFAYSIVPAHRRSPKQAWSMVRDGRFKLVERGPSNTLELYETDGASQETLRSLGEPEFEAVGRELQEALRRFQARAGT